MPAVSKHLTSEDIRHAEAVWAEYQRTHDVSNQQGRTAGIDPESGRIWFGDSILDVTDQQDVAGDTAPLFFIRIGSDYYFRKGGRR